MGFVLGALTIHWHDQDCYIDGISSIDSIGLSSTANTTNTINIGMVWLSSLVIRAAGCGPNR